VFSATALAGGAALLGSRASSARQGTPAATPASGTPQVELGPSPGGSLTIYCGRNEALVSDLMPIMAEATGIELDVRFGNTAELAAQILEEGDNTPAGLYFCQDAGALGSLAHAERFIELPGDILGAVDAAYRSPDGVWLGLSGRVRVLLYNPNVTDPATLPASILDLPQADLAGPIAWAPSNAPFQSFVTALRVWAGEDRARQWLEDVQASGVVTFDDNGPQIQAVASEEVAIGLVNHYYAFEAREEDPDIPVENYYFPDGDIGGLINVGGVGVIAGSGQEEQALHVTRYLLGEQAQTYFSEQTLEYPLASGIPAQPELVPLAEIQPPDIDLSDLADLEGTLALLTDLRMI
jgi:iron(III) transport system substrate-binding protein